MEKLANSILNILETELKALRKYGVDHLGYRFFLPDGRSLGCPTVKNWYKINRTDEFYKTMQEYLSAEIMRMHSKKLSYVTRSIEHKSNDYFEWLKKMGLDNSIGIYKFDNKRVDSFDVATLYRTEYIKYNYLKN
jgi:hypothetical protein